MEKNSRIFIVGNNDVAGNALSAFLKKNNFTSVRSSLENDFNLIDQSAVKNFFKTEKPEYVFLMHVISGGIQANEKYPAEFIFKNLQIQNNIIHYSYEFLVKKLFFLGSSCCYPKDCPQPIKEEYLLSGKVEITNESYSVAKIAGIKMVQAYTQQYGVNYIVAIPATIYGPGDKFNLEKGHVISSLIRKFHEAKVKGDKEVVVWGTGNPRREFIYVDDFVNACMTLMDNYDSSQVINIGTGKDVSIKELALLVKEVVGFDGELVFDDSKPDGVLRKLLDSSKIKTLGWKAHQELKQGIKLTYRWYESSSEDYGSCKGAAL